MAGAAIGLGVLVKVAAVLPAVALAGWLLFKGRRAATEFAVSAAAVIAAGYAIAGGVVALRPLRAASMLVSYPSFWDALRSWLGTTSVRTWSSIAVLAA